MVLITSTTTLHPEQAMYNMQTTCRIRANADLDCDNSAMRSTWTQTWVHRPIAAACMQGDLHDAYCAVCMCDGPVHVLPLTPQPSQATWLHILLDDLGTRECSASVCLALHACKWIQRGVMSHPVLRACVTPSWMCPSPCGIWPDPCGSWLESSAPATLSSNTWLCSASDASNAV